MIWGILIVLIVVCLGFLAWLFCIAPASPRGDFAEMKKYDYAHRGLHEKDLSVPENSMAGFKAAVEAGYGIEFDLQLTKDKKVVVHHDRSLKRVCGADVSIGDLTYKELQQYRLQNTEERVPLFSDVLALVDGRTPLIIELKHYDDADLLCPLVWELLRNYKGPYCVESFDPYTVQWFRKNHPYVLRGQLMGHFEGKDEECKGFFRALFWRNLWTNVLTRPHFEAYDVHFRNNISHRIACDKMKMQEVNWTLRTAEEYKVCKNAGALCIFEFIRPEITDEDE